MVAEEKNKKEPYSVGHKSRKTELLSASFFFRENVCLLVDFVSINMDHTNSLHE